MQQEKVNSNPPDIMGQLKPVKRQVPQKTSSESQTSESEIDLASWKFPLIMHQIE
jgi:hypothetical protein|uniref:Uncharacterized protein n=1 Tax=Elizabethkingia anophelis TaxID=1117645 RepID=A0A455ZEQ0_9FLAO|nr:TPA_exp: hypothetical protein [Elizabethkingia anophelis]